MNEMNLTQLEEQVLQTLIDSLYAEPGFSDVDAKDIACDTGIDIKSVRGVLSSLVKKDIISIYTNDSNYQIIYLNESHYHLHPKWKNEMA